MLFPALKEWLKARKLGPKSDASLKEINHIFIINVMLVALFLASVEHGMTIYSIYAKQLSEAAYVRRETELLTVRVKELQDHNDYLRGRYATAMKTIEYFSEDDPSKVMRSLEKTGVLDQVGPRSIPKQEKILELNNE